MSIYGTDTPLDSAYNYYVRITVNGIDCYSVGAESEQEAESMASILGAADDVQNTEVVES